MRVRSKSWLAGVVAAVLVLALVGCSSGGNAPAGGSGSQAQQGARAPAQGGGQPQGGQAPAPAQAVKVKISHPVRLDFANFPADVAQDQGFWKKRGVEVERVYFSGGGDQMRAVAANEAVIGTTSPVSAFNAAARGADVHMIATTVEQPAGWALAVPKDSPIQKLEDLKGKKIGISRPGSMTHWSAIKFLEKARLDPKKDATLVPAGEIEAGAAALKTGQIDALIVYPPGSFELIRKGEVRLVAQLPDVVKAVFNGWFATEKYLNENPDTVRKLLDGWYEAVKYMKANPDYSIRLLAKNMQISEETARQTYDTYMPFMSLDGTQDKAALQTVAQSLVELELQKSVPDLSKLISDKFAPTR